MKLIVIGNCRAIKRIVTNEDPDPIIAKYINRLGYIWMVDDTHATKRGGTGWQMVHELQEASIDKLRKTVLEILSQHNEMNERSYSQCGIEFVNEYRQRYYALVKNLFTREGRYLAKLASRFDTNRSWFFKDGQYYFREY